MDHSPSLRMQHPVLTGSAAGSGIAPCAPRDADEGRETVGHTSWRALLIGAPPLAA